MLSRMPDLRFFFHKIFLIFFKQGRIFMYLFSQKKTICSTFKNKIFFAKKIVGSEFVKTCHEQVGRTSSPNVLLLLTYISHLIKKCQQENSHYQLHYEMQATFVKSGTTTLPYNQQKIIGMSYFFLSSLLLHYLVQAW